MYIYVHMKNHTYLWTCDHTCIWTLRLYGHVCIYLDGNDRPQILEIIYMYKCLYVCACVCAWHTICMCVCVCLYDIPHMEWLQVVGSLKLHVSFAEYNLFCRALLQKRPFILRSLLIVATPYHLYHTVYKWYTIPYNWYGVAMISRLLKILGFFCRISSLLQGSFAKETCNFKVPTHRSHPIYHNWCIIHYTHFDTCVYF